MEGSILSNSRKIKKMNKQAKPQYDKIKFKDDKDVRKRTFVVVIKQTRTRTCAAEVVRFIDVVTFWSDRKPDPKFLKENASLSKIESKFRPQLREYFLYKNLKKKRYELILRTIRQHSITQIKKYFPGCLVYFHKELEGTKNLDKLEDFYEGQKYFRPSRREFTENDKPQCMLAKELKALHRTFELPGVFKYDHHLKEFQVAQEYDEFDEFDEFEKMEEEFDESAEEADDLEDEELERQDEEENDNSVAEDEDYIVDDDDDEQDEDEEEERRLVEERQRRRERRQQQQQAQAPAPQPDLMTMLQQMLHQQQQMVQQQLQEFQRNFIEQQNTERLQRLDMNDPMNLSGR